MSKIVVYFIDDHKAIFDRDKVVFENSDGLFSALSEAFPAEKACSEILNSGKALVNWANVCFVRALNSEEERDLYEE